MWGSERHDSVHVFKGLLWLLGEAWIVGGRMEEGKLVRGPVQQSRGKLVARA